jgi:hypothetical protein
MSPDEFTRVPSFCFPKGFERIDTPRASADVVVDQFVFEMHSQRRRWRIYGISLVCDLHKMEKVFFLNPNSRRYPVSFCFLSSNPVFSVQFHYLYFLVKCFTGTAGRYIHHEADFFRVAPDSVSLLPGLVSNGVTQHAPQIRVTKGVVTELCYIHSIVPDPYEDVAVQLTEKHSMTIPSQAVAVKCVSYSAMDVLFSVLSIPHIIQVFSILLLEKQLVFRSSNIHNLSLSLLCLRDLMKPFRYRGTFLPIVPLDENFLAVLESPMPFACGILKTEQQIAIPSYVCVIDLDRDEIIDPDCSPLVASGAQIVEKLQLFLGLNRSDVMMPPRIAQNGNRSQYLEFLKVKRNPLSSCHSYCMYPRKYCFGQEIVDAILLIFRDGLAVPLETLVRSCFITDKTDLDRPVTVFNNELFMESVDPDHVEFYRQFMQTTMFQEFIELMTDEPAMSPLALSDASDMTP